jgi:hypothetical protein
MAATVFNIAAGRVAGNAARVNANDPAKSVLVLVAINSSTAQSVLKDLTTLDAVLRDAGTREVTNSGYARIRLDDRSSITVTADNTGDQQLVDFPDQVFRAVAAGTRWTHLIVGYDSDSTGGTDANIEPQTISDFSIDPNGGDITAQVAAGGFFAART